MWGCVVLLWCRCSIFAPVLFKRCCAGLAAAPRERLRPAAGQGAHTGRMLDNIKKDFTTTTAAGAPAGLQGCEGLTIFVLHVRQGYDDRRRHMEAMMQAHGLHFEYVLEDDKSDLTPDVVGRYFAGDMARVQAATSCAAKHLAAYRRIVERNLEGALILEDDMLLHRDFNRVMGECLAEVRRRHLDGALCSLEDSLLKFVPRSQRRRGVHLYPAQRDRLGGAYYCTRGAAMTILAEAERRKCDRPIDLFHSLLLSQGLIGYYWCHPCIASQGTACGRFCSSIDRRGRRKQRYRRRMWRLKLAYKRLVYYLR